MTVVTLRQWQREALEVINKSPKDDVLIVAQPGSGKTILGVELARQMLMDNRATMVMVVVPTVSLRAQWGTQSSAMGVSLDYTIRNGDPVAKEFSGVVVTYAQIADDPDWWISVVDGHRSLVIIDEVHHMASVNSWGNALLQVSSDAKMRLLMSGTPFRGDGAPIPGVEYDHDDRCIPDYQYSYIQSVTDGVCRGIQCIPVDATVTWSCDGKVSKDRLSNLSGSDAGSALVTVLDVGSSWLEMSFRRANEILKNVRRDVPDAGGLIVAPDRYRAGEYAQMMSRICGSYVPHVVSGNAQAHVILDDFRRRGALPWMVSVQMVSEGVDIPRLMVGVYATNIRTRRYFIQWVGRFLRRRGRGDDLPATVLYPMTADIDSHVHHLSDEVMPSFTIPSTGTGIGVNVARDHSSVDPGAASDVQERDAYIFGSTSSNLPSNQDDEVLLSRSSKQTMVQNRRNTLRAIAASLPYSVRFSNRREHRDKQYKRLANIVGCPSIPNASLAQLLAVLDLVTTDVSEKDVRNRLEESYYDDQVTKLA